MRVELTYIDNESLVIDEVVKNAKRMYGPGVSVKVLPESNIPNDMLYFALQQIITHEQLSLFYNSGSREAYKQDMKKLRGDILFRVEQVLDTVILDNENKGT